MLEAVTTYLAKFVMAGLLLIGVTTGTTLITIPQWGTATLIEILWLVTGIIMVGVAGVYALPRVYGDYVITSRVPDAFTPSAVIIAKGRIRRELIRIAQGVIVFCIGAYACLVPSPIPGPAIISLTGVILTVGLFMLGLLTAVQSVLDRRDATNVEHNLAHTLEDIGEGLETVRNAAKKGEKGDTGEKGERGEKGEAGNGNGIKGKVEGRITITPDE